MQHPTLEQLKSGDVPVIASVSGGKDSTALSLWLTEQGIEHHRVFADTGWEHEATTDYVNDYLPGVLGTIDHVGDPRGMVGIIKHKGMFPRRNMRWCTELLKLKPIIAYMEQHDPERKAVSAVGIRAQESLARAVLDEWEYNDRDFNRWVWRPLIRWTFQDVVDIHKRHGVRPNPLYIRYNVERVGCWPCIGSRKSELAKMAKHDPARVDYIRELERTIVSPKGKVGASFFAPIRPGDYAQNGGSGGTPIDAVMNWATGGSAPGEQQQELFWEPAQDGCMRWGMCDWTGDADCNEE